MKKIKLTLASIFLLSGFIVFYSCSEDSNDNDIVTDSICLENSLEFQQGQLTNLLSSSTVSIRFEVTNSSSSDFDTSNGSIPLNFTIITRTEEDSTIETTNELSIGLIPAGATASVSVSGPYQSGETYDSFEIDFFCANE